MDTNPIVEGGFPGAGPKWPADVLDGDAPDDHGGGGGVDPAAIAAGHELDSTFAVKPILAIPIAVVITFVIGFSVAAGCFVYFNPPVKKDPFAHPEAVAESIKGTNERLDRTAREGLFKTKPIVDQPRLEPLKRLEKDGMFIARPAMPTGNSPEIHPEEIKPDRVAALQVAGYADKDHKFARIPIADAMGLAVADKAMFPVQKTASKPTPSADKPSSSSGGAGVQPAAPK